MVARRKLPTKAACDYVTVCSAATTMDRFHWPALRGTWHSWRVPAAESGAGAHNVERTIVALRAPPAGAQLKSPGKPGIPIGARDNGRPLGKTMRRTWQHRVRPRIAVGRTPAILARFRRRPSILMRSRGNSLCVYRH